jgi:hypothetical protein
MALCSSLIELFFETTKVARSWHNLTLSKQNQSYLFLT